MPPEDARPNRIKIREMQLADIPEADALRDAAGWNQTSQDWQTALIYQPRGCFVAVEETRIVGTVTTTSYGTDVGWIGMMLVDPREQRKGIATALMQVAIDFLQKTGVRCIRLDATPVGQCVYTRLGFEAEWDFHRWERVSGPTIHVTSVPQVDAAMLSKPLLQLDQQAFGANRCSWLKAVSGNSTCVADDDDGFGMVRNGSRASYLGPIVSRSVEGARRILATLLNTIDGQVYWDIPGPNLAATEMAQSLGFSPVRVLTRMRRGPESVQPSYCLLYGLYDPGMG